MQGGIEAEELVDVIIGIDELFGSGVINKAAVGTHASILVQDREVLFGSNGIGGGINFQELLIGYFPVQFAENKLIGSDGNGL